MNWAFGEDIRSAALNMRSRYIPMKYGSSTFTEPLADSFAASAILGLRHDPRLLKLPPYLSALCIIAGTVWLLLLPLDEYSRRTYVSENALLPGQVHTYFGGSEHNIFRAYRHEVHALTDKSTEEYGILEYIHTTKNQS